MSEPPPPPYQPEWDPTHPQHVPAGEEEKIPLTQVRAPSRAGDPTHPEHMPAGEEEKIPLTEVRV